jgi:hypothetical protein
MRVENYRAGQSVGWLAPPSSYSADRITTERHAVGRDHPSHDSVERSPSGDSSQLSFVGLDHVSHLIHDDPILGRDRMKYRPRFFCDLGLIGGGLHVDL